MESTGRKRTRRVNRHLRGWLAEDNSVHKSRWMAEGRGEAHTPPPSPLAQPLQKLLLLIAGWSADYLTCGDELGFAKKVPPWSLLGAIVSGDTHSHSHTHTHWTHTVCILLSVCWKCQCDDPLIVSHMDHIDPVLLPWHQFICSTFPCVCVCVFFLTLFSNLYESITVFVSACLSVCCCDAR